MTLLGLRGLVCFIKYLSNLHSPLFHHFGSKIGYYTPPHASTNQLLLGETVFGGLKKREPCDLPSHRLANPHMTCYLLLASPESGRCLGKKTSSNLRVSITWCASPASKSGMSCYPLLPHSESTFLLGGTIYHKFGINMKFTFFSLNGVEVSILCQDLKDRPWLWRRSRSRSADNSFFPTLNIRSSLLSSSLS